MICWIYFCTSCSPFSAAYLMIRWKGDYAIFFRIRFLMGWYYENQLALYVKYVWIWSVFPFCEGYLNAQTCLWHFIYLFISIIGLSWVFLFEGRFFLTLTLTVNCECLVVVCALFFSSFPYFLLLPLSSICLVTPLEWDSFMIFFYFYIFGQRNVNSEWPSHVLSKELFKPLIFFFFRLFI